MTEGAASAPKGFDDKVSPRDQTTTSDPAASSLPTDLPLNPNANSPEELWNDYFSKRRPSARTVRDLVSRLHASRKHDHVAAVIRAALRSGQSQPWMYEVLALTLEIQGEPKSEVERALLSQIDFAATDAAGLMMSAAYLTRFEADRPALRLYRQASDLAPERPEPYLLGLNSARRLGDDDALAWAIRGIFASAWGKGHAKQQTEAENAATDRARELHAAGQADEAASLLAAVTEAKQVDLHVRLDWGGAGDLDLSVLEPAGTVCSFENPRTQAGGVLTHDGHGPKQDNCYDEYVCAAGFNGVYRITVRHAWGDIVGKRARLAITRHRGTAHESVRSIALPIAEEGSTVRVTLAAGRRAELVAVPDEPDLPAIRPVAYSPLVRHLDPDAEAAAQRFRDSLFAQVGGGGGFVGGLTPAVGVGAVGFQPTVTVIPDGIILQAQAIVSPDRRYVRLTLSPTFNEVIDVLHFTFNTAPTTLP